MCVIIGIINRLRIRECVRRLDVGVWRTGSGERGLT